MSRSHVRPAVVSGIAMRGRGGNLRNLRRIVFSASLVSLLFFATTY
jgi:hypothetical protein